ncbi:ribosomal small subunit Rsm22 [Humibacillus sp. DSM 29435]|uniref:small ribosomal subunit Rsm22 family protein n=1 Tax=Humibacillus sp. DSM 29435 TaxID=1869167 RepID=UPI00087215DE|nr:small ribosomal subunit Rsm22 family protein [Humibacillus sp. DSM 29435]OFE18645.1 ribosomal small subunit Rsm22 [Humibacillus sp. DSM 29435]
MRSPETRYAAELRSALGQVVRTVPARELTDATAALVARYRSVAPAAAPILASTTQVAAYAAYRMPATHAALVSVLGDLASAGLSPRSMVDLGGGTGAAAWAAAECFDRLESIVVFDQVGEALRLGRDLVACVTDPVLAGARFERAEFRALPQVRGELVTISYVLSELGPAEQESLLVDAMRCGDSVVVVEPGTPDGYQRILTVRQQLLEAGWRLAGPCPHEADCPLRQGDWCHFATRLERSADHRRIKGGELSYEDEKFSWVAATSPSSPALPARSARILRHPLKRKGMVEFQVCRPDGTAGREVVSKRAGLRYRAARDADWGDELP